MKRIAMMIVCFGVLHAEHDFTVKKKKKEPSVQVIKENCCELFGDLLKEIPTLLQETAHVQTRSLGAIQGFFESDKQSLCERMTKEQLSICNKKVETVLEQMDSLIAQLHELDVFLVTIPPSK
jgi:hypothetical protein